MSVPMTSSDLERRDARVIFLRANLCSYARTVYVPLASCENFNLYPTFFTHTVTNRHMYKSISAEIHSHYVIHVNYKLKSGVEINDDFWFLFNWRNFQEITPG